MAKLMSKSDLIQKIADQFSDKLTRRDVKGVLERPIGIDDYPLPWYFQLGVLQNQNAISGFANTSTQINYAIGQVRTVGKAVDDAQRRQVLAHNEMRSTLGTLTGFAKEQSTIASTLTVAIGELKRRVEALRGSVQRFRV